MNEITDVVVVGAGPVGLLTAIELALGGARVVVLERLAAPSTLIKAGGIGPLGSEALQRRGMAAALAAAEEASFAARKLFTDKTFSTQTENGQTEIKYGPTTKIGGHFAGLTLIRRDVQKEPERRARLVDQQGIEAMLADCLRSLGVEVRRDCTVTAFAEQEDGIDVEWSSAKGRDEIRCAFLIGCDGGRSAIRKLAGFDFPGTEPTMTMYQAVVEIDRPDDIPFGWFHTSQGVLIYGFMPGRIGMLDFSGPPKDREAPVTQEEIESVLCRISGKDIRVTACESASRWADNTRLVDRYRKGRVFLAGDAAHIHSPFGGQGLSLGLVDAANLGWKLAAVLRGDSPESLLDTYTTERRPVAEAVLANTLAQLAIMRPDPQSTAMRAIFAKLLQFDDVNRFVGEMMGSLSIPYDLGATRDDVGRLIGDRPISADLSLYDLMQDGAGVLLDASSGAIASTLVSNTTHKIRCVTVDTGPSMLIRPDACIAWCSEGWAAKGNDTEGLEDALHHWFAPARVRE